MHSRDHRGGDFLFSSPVGLFFAFCRSAHGYPAIHMQYLAGYVFRILRNQEDHSPPNFLHRLVPFEWCGRSDNILQPELFRGERFNILGSKSFGTLCPLAFPSRILSKRAVAPISHSGVYTDFGKRQLTVKLYGASARVNDLNDHGNGISTAFMVTYGILFRSGSLSAMDDIS